jgi:lysophospholipase L1-like esterase
VPPYDRAVAAVLCFGDSNTWGSHPETGERLGRDVRWPGVLRRSLGDVDVVEEGLPGRTAASHDPLRPHWTALPYLLPALESHAPLDVLVLMLGTNDVQERYGLTAGTIADQIAGLADIAAGSACGPAGGSPAVLLVAPPPLGRLADALSEAEYGPGIEKSRALAPLLAAAAETADYPCDFLDGGSVAALSAADGIHLDAEAHERLGRAIAERVSILLGR